MIPNLANKGVGPVKNMFDAHPFGNLIDESWFAMKQCPTPLKSLSFSSSSTARLHHDPIGFEPRSNDTWRVLLPFYRPGTYTRRFFSLVDLQSLATHDIALVTVTFLQFVHYPLTQTTIV